ncbi:MAG TPA: hypothetical protein ENN73_05240 [Firmicutes bacterium]|nr:hypothetical protein [Bacillota bacterium]
MRSLSILCLIAAVIVIIIGLVVKMIFRVPELLPMGIQPKTYIQFTEMLLLFSIAFYLIGGTEEKKE